jgi:C-terminal processing protease CtpA/Prc
LGIEVSGLEHFGMVEVSTVTTASPADGRLQPGDRIFGIDGRLLQMASPLDDLQQWWAETVPGSSHSLRVLRGNTVIELEVSRRFDEMSLDDLFGRPIDLLREVSVLCEAVPFSTLHIHFTGDRHTSALVSMRLATED